jgi:hypothetical protein
MTAYAFQFSVRDGPSDSARAVAAVRATGDGGLDDVAVRKPVGLDVDHEHHREFEPFGLVDGGDHDGVRSLGGVAGLLLGTSGAGRPEPIRRGVTGDCVASVSNP